MQLQRYHRSTMGKLTKRTVAGFSQSRIVLDNGGALGSIRYLRGGSVEFES